MYQTYVNYLELFGKTVFARQMLTCAHWKTKYIEPRDGTSFHWCNGQRDELKQTYMTPRRAVWRKKDVSTRQQK